MQLQKIILTSAKFILITSSLLFLQSCNSKKDSEEEIEWSATMCAPANYPISGPHIYFFKEGKGVGRAEALLSIFQDWALPASARSSRSSVLPDSIFVSYFAPNDQAKTFYYEGGSRLPSEKIIALFKEGYLEGKKRKNFDEVRTGLAPGGRVCVWANHVEVFRFKAKEKGQFSDSLMVTASNDAEYSANYESTEKYINNHPIDYSIWEKPDARYDLDFGFCSEGNNTKYFNCYFYTKEGIAIVVSKLNIDLTDWNKPFGKPVSLIDYKNYTQTNGERDKKLNIPVHAVFEWKKDDKIFYSTDVVLPADLSIRFLKEYSNTETGQKANYNRIVFGVEKDGEHCIVWLDGPGKQEKIMRFKGNLQKIDKDKTVNSGGYATEVTYY